MARFYFKQENVNIKSGNWKLGSCIPMIIFPGTKSFALKIMYILYDVYSIYYHFNSFNSKG